MMFGFAKKSGGNVEIANRIFEVRLYNYFLATAEAQSSETVSYTHLTLPTKA